MKALAWSVLALSLAVPMIAQADVGYLVDNVNLRAGPDPEYPLIDQLQAGTEVDVQGCTQGWEWCDVIVNDERGWVAGNYIQYDYDDQPVILTDYGAQIGIPIVTFSIGAYWGSYYAGQPFYSQRDYWYRQPFVNRPPPPPAPPRYGPHPMPWHGGGPGPVQPGRPYGGQPPGYNPHPGYPGQGQPGQPGHLGPVRPGAEPGMGMRPPIQEPIPNRPMIQQNNRPATPPPHQVRPAPRDDGHDHDDSNGH